jgi:hypothetical protein
MKPAATPTIGERACTSLHFKLLFRVLSFVTAVRRSVADADGGAVLCILSQM